MNFESEKKINAVLALEQITHKDFKGLAEDEVKKLLNTLTSQLSEAKGDERDKIVRKVESFIPESVKNNIWENNHLKITGGITNLMNENGIMPCKSQLAEKTGLSPQTINKHLKEYSSNPQFIGQEEQFRFMKERILARVFHFALHGDMKAAKLFLEIINNQGEQKPPNTLIQNQTNYIQINGTILSQELIKQLSPEQLSQIESIIKAVTIKTVNS